MNNACIFHGIGGTPKDFWLPYVKKELEVIKYTVWSPQLPQADDPNLEIQLPFVLSNFNYDNDSVLIGHSSGCPLILSLLENIDIKVNLSILVSGFVDSIPNGPDKILQKEYNWDKIKMNSDKFIFINSDDDPWGCNDIQGRKMFDNLGGELIIRHGQGHMGSDSYNQPYKEFPLLINLIKTFN